MAICVFNESLKKTGKYIRKKAKPSGTTELEILKQHEKRNYIICCSFN
jgi:hypothetical protein